VRRVRPASRVRGWSWWRDSFAQIAAEQLLPDDVSTADSVAYVDYLRLQLQGPLTESLLDLLETVFLDHDFESWKARGGVA
jgi:hypothetical protein